MSLLALLANQIYCPTLFWSLLVASLCGAREKLKITVREGEIAEQMIQFWIEIQSLTHTLLKNPRRLRFSSLQCRYASRARTVQANMLLLPVVCEQSMKCTLHDRMYVDNWLLLPYVTAEKSHFTKNRLLYAVVVPYTTLERCFTRDFTLWLQGFALIQSQEVRSGTSVIPKVCGWDEGQEFQSKLREQFVRWPGSTPVMLKWDLLPRS